MPGRGSSAARPTGSWASAATCSGADERARPDHHGDLGLRRRADHAPGPVVRRRPGRDRHPVRGARQGDGADRRSGTARHPLFELETGRLTEADFLEQARRRPRAGPRPPAGAAPLQRDLLRRAPPQRADDRADARGEGAAATAWRCSPTTCASGSRSGARCCRSTRSSRSSSTPASSAAASRTARSTSSPSSGWAAPARRSASSSTTSTSTATPPASSACPRSTSATTSRRSREIRSALGLS